ncbi:hypothetical protein D3C81_1601710 [compost metagenome]
MKSQNSLAKSLEAITERLEQVERQPLPRKSAATVIEKSFNHSAGVPEAKNELSKSEKLQKLTDMVVSGVEGVSAYDVINFESVGTLRPEVQKLLDQK